MEHDVEGADRIPIIVPDMGTPRVRFSLWYVPQGADVLEGDRVAEVLIPGATYAIPAPATGRLAERAVQPNDPLAAGQVLGTIERT